MIGNYRMVDTPEDIPLPAAWGEGVAHVAWKALFNAPTSHTHTCTGVYPPPFAPPGNFPWKPVDRALTLAVLAQSLATLRCCSVARDVIILADIFEEEDFYPSTFGFRLAPPVEDDSLTELLALAEGAMRERVSLWSWFASFVVQRRL